MLNAKIAQDGKLVPYGKYKGYQWSMVPIRFLKFQLNNKTSLMGQCERELKRRGAVNMDYLEVTFHAINRASVKLLNEYLNTRKPDEGIHDWLHRLATIASYRMNSEMVVNHEHICFTFIRGLEGYILVTVYPEREHVPKENAIVTQFKARIALKKGHRRNPEKSHILQHK